MTKVIKNQEKNKSGESNRYRKEKEEQRRRKREELNIKLPEPLKPWAMKKTLSKRVIPYFEKSEHPLMVAKKLRANPNTVRSYWWRWRHKLGI